MSDEDDEMKWNGNEENLKEVRSLPKEKIVAKPAQKKEKKVAEPKKKEAA
ncbi:MAG: hypothetical protein HRU15_13270, partial [Planctomycetes bacterium]|nr:hypothetical protein [Planctomycetota bacterium]